MGFLDGFGLHTISSICLFLTNHRMIDLDLPDYYTQMNHKNLEVLCLQKHPEYYEQTITLLNQQWPRSRTARLV